MDEARQEPPDAGLPPLARLRAIVAVLRAPGGCPWDRAQTHATLRASLVEETYEVLDAIDRADDADLCEELGDLLLQVVMHANLAAERGAFDLDAVARGVAEKMLRRHPHVFAGAAAADTAAVLTRWDEIKRQEKGASPQQSRLDGILPSLPALLRAQKVQVKAARTGFDWQNAADVFAKVREEVEEIAAAATPEAVADEIGDLLFAAVNLARWHKLEAELLLRSATDKFTRRFQALEAALHTRGRRWEDAAPAELDALWDQVKLQAAAGGSMNENRAAAVKDNEPI